MKRFVQTITELCAMVPKLDGSRGITPTYCRELVQRTGITKTAKGYNVAAFLKAVRQIVRAPDPAGDELDAELKRRKIKLLDLEIGRVEGSLADVDEVVRRVVAHHAEMVQRLATWSSSSIAKHPALRVEIEQITRELQAGLAEGWDE